MNIARFTAIVVAALLFVISSWGQSAVARTPAPRLQLRPATVADGAKVTMYGAHLRRSTYYTFLLAVPNATKPLSERLFGPYRSDSHGRLKRSLALPIVLHCGRASVYAYVPGKAAPLRAKITITGCKLDSKHPIKPPSPPGGPKPPPPPH